MKYLTFIILFVLIYFGRVASVEHENFGDIWKAQYTIIRTDTFNVLVLNGRRNIMLGDSVWIDDRQYKSSFNKLIKIDSKWYLSN